MSTLAIKKLKTSFYTVCLTLIATACSLNSQDINVNIDNTLPEAKTATYQDAIKKLGLMSVIYGRLPLKIMNEAISDQTATSVSSNTEISEQITALVKNTLDKMDGNIIFIPYDPDSFANAINTGYANVSKQLVPDVIVAGGITELETTDQNTNNVSMSQITLDFNMIDFNTLAGFPQIQAINGIKIDKSIKKDSLTFTVKSFTLGARGNIKKIQQRQTALKLLVELSMTQLIGRYQQLPYWRLLPGEQKDKVVIDLVLNDFYNKNESEKTALIQSYLYLHGYQVSINGHLDIPTQIALQKFSKTVAISTAKIDQATYLALYENIPLNNTAREKSKKLVHMLADYKKIQPANTVSLANKSLQVLVDDGKLSLTTDKSNYLIGDNMTISFSVDKAMFVRLVVINSKGKISTLFPNVYQTDNYCQPGLSYQIPPEHADFTLDIDGPIGTDKIRAVASRNPVPAGALHFTSDTAFDKVKMVAFPVREATNITIR